MWDPYTLKNIQKIKSVSAYRICSGSWSASYEELLDLLKIPSLASCRWYLRLLTLHKFHCGHSYFPPDILSVQPVISTRSSASSAYKIPFAHMTQFKHSFPPRTLHLWNNLPHDLLDSDPILFKCILKHYVIAIWCTLTLALICYLCIHAHAELIKKNRKGNINNTLPYRIKTHV